MVQRQRPDITRDRPAEQELRDQEVLRANRELAAYFKGRRTEREARAALKIIKAFVRDRQRRAPASRPPLPGTVAAKTAPSRPAARQGGKKGARKPPRRPRDRPSGIVTLPVRLPADPGLPSRDETA